MNTSTKVEITNGRKLVPVKAVVYGPAGIGKSTLAAGLPKPLFLDCEGGTNNLDVARVTVSSAAQLNEAVYFVVSGKHDYRTLVIDTADWAEQHLLSELLASRNDPNIQSIEDFGYGKGYPMLAAKFSGFLRSLDAVVARGIHVVFLAHAKIAKVSPPELLDGYDAYELKLTKNVSPLLKEWAEMILFANHDVAIRKGKDGKNRGENRQARYLYTTPSAAWTAKNRYGLADCLDLAPASILHLFNGARPKSEAAPVAEKVPAAVKPPAEDRAPVAALEKFSGVVPSVPAGLEWLAGDAEAAVKYLVEKKGWLKAGQSLGDLDANRVADIIKYREAFSRAMLAK